MSDKPTTDFGYQTVHTDEKQRLVNGVFDSVASRYDVMNDVMSVGIHRVWKRFTIELSAVRPGHQVLDLAGGTGDLAAQFGSLVSAGGAQGRVVLADINTSMLVAGRDKLLDRGMVDAVEYVQANAECLPFADDTFECVTMAFGLRNITDKACALRAVLRVLKPGGRCLILEFSKPTNAYFTKIYDFYSFHVLPLMGRWVAGDAESYRYLAESIRRHPDQETLKTMMGSAGFADCEYHNMTGGVVAVHKGVKKV